MPIAVVGITRVSAAVSPLTELGCALHVANDPAHHGADLPLPGAALSRRVTRWAFTTRAIRATPFVTVWGPDDGFAAQLDRLRSLSPATLAASLLRPISPGGDRGAALRYGRARGVDALVTALVERPGPAVAEFLEFLEESWESWFAPLWATRVPALAARARRFAHEAATTGPVTALTRVDRAITAAGGSVGTRGGVTIAKVQSRRHDVSRRGLVVVPSTFIHPHLYVADVPRQPLLVIHPVDEGPPALSTRDLLRRLSVLANPARLEVARAIATEPRTAGEIAALWHLDPTLVTRHLRALSAAGLARATRRGRFVEYRLDATAVDTLGPDLLALLLR